MSVHDTVELEDRVQDLGQTCRSQPSTRLRRRQERLDQRELGIRQIGCVAAAEAHILTAGGSGPHDESSSFPAELGVS